MATHLERFQKWACSDEGKEYYRKKIKRYGDWQWVKDQYRLMADWIEDNPIKGNKKDWPKFTGNWLRRNYGKRVDNIANSKCPGLMTAEQEQDHYNKPREKPFVKVGDILSGKAQKENS